MARRTHPASPPATSNITSPAACKSSAFEASAPAVTKAFGVSASAVTKGQDADGGGEFGGDCRQLHGAGGRRRSDWDGCQPGAGLSQWGAAKLPAEAGSGGGGGGGGASSSSHARGGGVAALGAARLSAGQGATCDGCLSEDSGVVGDDGGRDGARPSRGVFSRGGKRPFDFDAGGVDGGGGGGGDVGGGDGVRGGEDASMRDSEAPAELGDEFWASVDYCGFLRYSYEPGTMRRCVRVCVFVCARGRECSRFLPWISVRVLEQRQGPVPNPAGCQVASPQPVLGLNRKAWIKIEVYESLSWRGGQASGCVSLKRLAIFFS